MAIKTDNLVFYHIPKTGGVFVKEAIRKACQPYGRALDDKDYQNDHPFGLKRAHSTPDGTIKGSVEGLFSFCFVRHPVTWYKSYWAYRIKTCVLDFKFSADHYFSVIFEQFLNNILDAYPHGFVTELYQYYVGVKADEIDFIGRQENLLEDLFKALSLANEDYNEEFIRDMKWINIAHSSKKYGKMCKIKPHLERRIIAVEHWVMENFYNEKHTS